jgi:hypothetical protein
MSWDPNGNPPYTAYVAEISNTFNFFPLAGSATSVGSYSALFSGLNAATVYYVRVRAMGLAPNTEADSVSITTMTLPAQLQGLSAAALGISSITWSWGGVAGATGYDFQPSTGGPPISWNATSLTLVGLSTNTPYSASVAAVYSGGPGPYSAAATAYTLAAAPALSSSVVLGVSSVTVYWSGSGNPAGTPYVSEIWVSTSVWQPVVVKTTAATTATAYTFSSLSPGATYLMDIYALNGANVASPPSVTTSTFFNYLFNSVTATISPELGGCLSLNAPHGPVTACFPPGAFPIPVTAALQGQAGSPPLPDALSSAAPLALVGAGVGAELDVLPAMQPLQPVTMTIGYGAADVGSLSANSFVLAYYDPAENLWVPLPSTSLTSVYQVTGQAHHLSQFQIMSEAPASDLSSPKVYPNPFRPALGHTQINFSQLPANAHIRVYTILGELVKDLYTNGNGTAAWDATNQSGQSAASGSYFALVQANGNKSIMKVLIQR